LDSNLQPTPFGQTGELYIGGAGVARGYWNRPELTQERFLPDLFCGEPDARMYKSGDLVRYREDGVLEYLGRVDDQVKLRGYRIELGEIEVTLSGHPEVQSCAVLVREDEPGDQRLVGYVVPAKNESLSTEELNRFLGERLPEYMIPTHFVFLGSLPLTPNGKIDRKVLPAPSNASIADNATFVAPRTETEKTLAAIWTNLMKVENIGVHDDFFELGMHSLTAVRAVTQIREAFGVEIPFVTLFESPTIASLAKILGDKD
jgi:acyl carrier protein